MSLPVSATTLATPAGRTPSVVGIVVAGITNSADIGPM